MYTCQDVIVQRKSADCSLTPEALLPLAAMWTDGQVDGTGAGTEGQGQKAKTSNHKCSQGFLFHLYTGSDRSKAWEQGYKTL